MSIFGGWGSDKPRGKRVMSTEEFRKWLMEFDHNKDGRISRKELRDAIRSCGVWFSSWRSGRAMGEADFDDSGYIDENEIGYLVAFAEKELGFKIW